MSTKIDLHAKCDRCGHSYSFHGKAMRTTCRAMGCKGGKEGARCPGFVVPKATSLSQAS